VACLATFIYFNKEKLKESKYHRYFTQVAEKLEEFKTSLFVEKWDATLYFGDENSDFLVKEFRRVSSLKAPELKAAVLINELIKGPHAKGVRTIPEQTKLRSVKVDKEGLARVDFGPELSDFHPGGSSSELMTVFSVVNTLTSNIKEARRVKISIDGKDIDTIAGHIDCSKPFSSNQKIVR
jgi:spore germination protein GerM